MKSFTILALALLVVSCRAPTSETPSSCPVPPIVLDAPVEFSLVQRTTTALPGSKGRVVVTIDDITKAQVRTALSWQDGTEIVTARSLRENDAVTFRAGGYTYKIKLKKLTNLLVGEDSARFELWPGTPEPAAPILLEGPVEFPLRQRTTAVLPGSDGKMVATIGDITRGQVMTTLSWHNGPHIVAPRSLRENDVVTFTAGNHRYRIKLTKLTNFLVGEDSATFRLWHATDERDDSPADRAVMGFSAEKDLLSLHYDHAPDKDDAHSAAADRTILESLYGTEWIEAHVVPVSGAYGKNAKQFNAQSDAVMDAAWGDCVEWLAAHTDRPNAVGELAERWIAVLQAGGDVWVKEGGQSDITEAAVKRIRSRLPDLDTPGRIHVVQHSRWNENQTTDTALAYTRRHTHYIKIRDANSYLNIEGGDRGFEKSAINHPNFKGAWKAAFEYYDPEERLDFSDTGELMHIVGLGEMGVDEFRRRFLDD